MILNRFNYNSLSRESVNGERLYCTPTGEKLPSVTTILSKTKDKESEEALAKWRAAVGEERAKQITEEAAGRGTRMHKFLETYVETGEMPLPSSNPYSKQSHIMAQTILEKGLVNVSEFNGIEVNLYFPGLYAGTTDCVGIHNGELAIIDYKQSNKVKSSDRVNDYRMQLAAYAIAHNELFGTNIRKGVIMMCVKPELTKGTFSQSIYQEFIVDDEFDYWEEQWLQRVEAFYHLS